MGVHLPDDGDRRRAPGCRRRRPGRPGTPAARTVAPPEWLPPWASMLRCRPPGATGPLGVSGTVGPPCPTWVLGPARPGRQDRRRSSNAYKAAGNSPGRTQPVGLAGGVPDQALVRPGEHPSPPAPRHCLHRHGSVLAAVGADQVGEHVGSPHPTWPPRCHAGPR